MKWSQQRDLEEGEKWPTVGSVTASEHVGFECSESKSLSFWLFFFHFDQDLKGFPFNVVKQIRCSSLCLVVYTHSYCQKWLMCFSLWLILKEIRSPNRSNKKCAISLKELTTWSPYGRNAKKCSWRLSTFNIDKSEKKDNLGYFLFGVLFFFQHLGFA